MTRWRSTMLGVVLWSVVVALGASVTWVVISRVGEELGESRDQPVPGAAPSGDPEAPTPSDSAETGTAETGTADPTWVRDSWQGEAGELVVRCRGSEIEFVAARGDNGHLAEREDDGPARVRVDFDRGDSRIRVEATCQGGVPQFSVDADD